MTKSTTKRIIYTVIVATVIILTASFYRYTPNNIMQDLKKNRHVVQRMKITIVNQNKVGSGRWIELRCKGYQDYDISKVWWSGMALVHPGKKHNFTLPTISETDSIQVYCKYKGSNGCMANKVKLFESPWTDNFYCGNDVGRCAFSFKPDGLVEKEYVGALNRTVGYIPEKSKLRKCPWVDCLLSKRNLIIGDKTCCGSDCASW